MCHCLVIANGPYFYEDDEGKNCYEPGGALSRMGDLLSIGALSICSTFLLIVRLAIVFSKYFLMCGNFEKYNNLLCGRAPYSCHWSEQFNAIVGWVRVLDCTRRRRMG